MSKTPAPKKTPKAPVAKQPATASRKAAARKAAATTAADRKAAAIEAGPPFIRDTLPNGEQAWRMSPALAKRYDELKYLVGIQDEENQAAVYALLNAETQLMNKRNNDAHGLQLDHGPTPPKLAFTGFAMPLARRLHTLRLPENRAPHRREKIRKEAVAWFRKEAVAWVQKVIENAFSDLLPGKLSAHAIEVIETALNLLFKNGQIPDKTEIRQAMEQRAEHSGLDKGTWRKRFLMAGLGDLKQSRGY